MNLPWMFVRAIQKQNHIPPLSAHSNGVDTSGLYLHPCIVHQEADGLGEGIVYIKEIGANGWAHYTKGRFNGG